MGKIYEIKGYVVDPNDSVIDFTMSLQNNGLMPFLEISHEPFEWDDALEINRLDATNRTARDFYSNCRFDNMMKNLSGFSRDV